MPSIDKEYPCKMRFTQDWKGQATNFNNYADKIDVSKQQGEIVDVLGANYNKGAFFQIEIDQSVPLPPFKGFADVSEEYLEEF